MIVGTRKRGTKKSPLHLSPGDSGTISSLSSERGGKRHVEDQYCIREGIVAERGEKSKEGHEREEPRSSRAPFSTGRDTVGTFV